MVKVDKMGKLHFVRVGKDGPVSGDVHTPAVHVGNDRGLIEGPWNEFVIDWTLSTCADEYGNDHTERKY